MVFDLLKAFDYIESNCRKTKCRIMCRQYRVHDYEHERGEGRVPEQDGRHQAVHGVQVRIHNYGKANDLAPHMSVNCT